MKIHFDLSLINRLTYPCPPIQVIKAAISQVKAVTGGVSEADLTRAK
jgi:hypothetical protein